MIQQLQEAFLLYRLQIGRTIVFETLDSAAAYRQLVAQVLRSSLPTVVSLDGGKLSSTGVVAGSGFKVVQISQAAQCFGMAPDSPQVIPQSNGSGSALWHALNTLDKMSNKFLTTLGSWPLSSTERIDKAMH
jgi:hypothetical protein